MAKKGNTVVLGIFSSRGAAEDCVNALRQNGFRNSDISVLMPDLQAAQNFAHEKGTKAPEGATAGATGGAILGGAFGWLAGVGALAIPGIGPFVAAGPILAAFAGAGIGGAVGGIGGAVIGMGIPEYEAKRYETFVKDGGILLSAHVDDGEWRKKAKDVLSSCGATEISSTTEEKSDFDRDDIDDQDRPTTVRRAPSVRV